MNETDFQLFTQSNDQTQKTLSHSTPKASKNHPQMSTYNHCSKADSLSDSSEATASTSKTNDSFEAKPDPQISRQNDYRDIIDADDSFEAKLSQMTEFDKVESDRESAMCTPNKLFKLKNYPDASKTPVLSKKLQKKLNFQ